jgi:hypothetical protein
MLQGKAFFASESLCCEKYLLKYDILNSRGIAALNDGRESFACCPVFDAC